MDVLVDEDEVRYADDYEVVLTSSGGVKLSPREIAELNLHTDLID